jgi:hypothetical protein
MSMRGMPATRAGDSHQTWARDPAAGSWRFDVFREPRDWVRPLRLPR